MLSKKYALLMFSIISLLVGIVIWFSILLLWWAENTWWVSVEEIVLASQTGNIGLIDLRTEREVQITWIIPWAIHIDYYKDDFEQKISELPKNVPYIIYCHSWVRSWKTIEIMQELWFKNIRDYSPWIRGWLAAWGTTIEEKEAY